MNPYRNLLFASACLLAPLGVASAQQSQLAPPELVGLTPDSITKINYDFVQLRSLDTDREGLRVDWVRPLDQDWFFTSKFELAELTGNTDIQQLSFGAGYAASIADQYSPLDLVAEFEVDLGRQDNGAQTDTDVGFRVRGGARYMPVPEVEMFAGATLRTTFDSTLIFDFGSMYHFENGVSFMAGIEAGDESGFFAGLRYAL
ncbi:MAG: hypothetical protein ACYS26_05590 [Planctomycetota bacterium]|jgi:hypothetical protein